MQENSIVQLSNQRPLNLVTYVVVGIMYVLSSRTIADPLTQAAVTVLCATFALLHAFVLPREDFPRCAKWYFAGQTLVLAALLALHPQSAEFYSFLVFILAVHAAVVFPARTAAGWLLLFYLLTGLSAFAWRGLAALDFVSFNVAVFLICGVTGHNLRQTELARRHNQQLVEDLQNAQRQLEELAVAKERNRLAREIHDGLGHYLTATTMQIQGAKALLDQTEAARQAPAALSALGKAESLLQEALADVRRSVAALRTAPAANRPLATAIGQLISECRTLGGIDAQFTVAGAPRAISSQAELTLFRVAQEGLTNVRKHAQATQVAVTLCYDPQTVRLRITDNGQGIGEATTGFGLLGLHERVDLLGGTVMIDSQPGAGCRLEVEIPA
ncbi:MAG TPA: sensor histidine kinase [Caldilineaceae bacterium]|nr:sensor histidine kinase [Caldilineaceae bacterium]